MNEIKLYPIEKFEPHPNNPRKDLGDLQELSDSIRQFGILQNLIVVESEDKLRVVAGHRRLAAAKLAKVKELPAVIRDLDEKKQQELMLLENMQRNDLTLMEQAEGFQMLMDLGSSIKDIARETGFAETTIRHRIKIAELDKEIIEKVEEDRGYQLSLREYIELEKLKGKEARNKFLEAYGGSNDFDYYLDRAVKEQKKEDLKRKLIKKVEDAGMLYQEARSWEQKVKDWTIIDSLDADVPDTSYYCTDAYMNGIACYNYKTKEEEAAEEKQDDLYSSFYEKKRELRGRLENIIQDMNDEVLDYLDNKMKENIGVTEYNALVKKLLLVVLAHYDAPWIEKKDFEEAKGLSIEAIILRMLESCQSDFNLFSYLDMSYIGLEDEEDEVENANNMLIDIVKELGFTWSEESELLMNNKHPLQIEYREMK